MGTFLSLLTKIPSIKVNSECCHNNNNSYSERQCTKCGSFYKIPTENKRLDIAQIDELTNKSKASALASSLRGNL